MKKAFVLLLALAVLGGAAFAEDAYTVSGSATLAWGYNIETGATGFENSAEFELEFPLVAGASKSASGEDVYGYISISDINLKIIDTLTGGPNVIDNDNSDDALEAEVTAKIVAGNFYAMVYPKSGLDFNKAAEIDGTVDAVDDVKVVTASDLYGTKLGITGDYAFAFIIDSAESWKANVANDYALGFTSYLKLVKDGDTEVVSLDLAAAYDLANETFGASIAVPMTFGTLKVKPMADVVNTTALTYDARLDMSFGFDEKSNTKVEAMAYYSDTDDDLELKVGFAEKEAAGLVDMLAFSAYFTATNVLNGQLEPYNVAVSGSYKSMLDDTFYVKPGFSVTYYSTEQLKASVYLDAKLIANTVFTLKWAGDDVTEKVLTDVTAGTINLGSVTFAAKISL